MRHVTSDISRLFLFSNSGRLIADCEVHKDPVSVNALVASGPLLFVAEGQFVNVRSALTLEPLRGGIVLNHPVLEQEIISLSLSPFATQLVATDRGWSSAIWRVERSRT